MTQGTKPKLTQTIVGAAMKRTPDGKQFAEPQILRDHEVGGLLLVVGCARRRGASTTSPMGRSRTGAVTAKVRMPLGDAMTMPVPDARTTARAVKVEVAQGRDPHARRRTRGRQSDRRARYSAPDGRRRRRSLRPDDREE